MTAIVLLAGGAPALAHVDVLPTEVPLGEALEFTVRVPNEREVPTTRVEVEFPAQITVYSFATPPSGWTARPVVGTDNRIRGVVYSGGRIGVDRYADFTMLGTPFESGAASWLTRQTYADGTVKPWTGPAEEPGSVAAESGPSEPGPAAVVTVVEPGQPVAPTASADEGSGAAIWLGVIAIAVSALALLALGFLWSTRPARLPGGHEDR